MKSIKINIKNDSSELFLKKSSPLLSKKINVNKKKTFVLFGGI